MAQGAGSSIRPRVGVTSKGRLARNARGSWDARLHELARPRLAANVRAIIRCGDVRIGA